MTVQRKIQVVTTATMETAPLFAQMQAVSDRRLAAALRAIRTVCNERSDYEASKERVIKGVLTVGQSPDIAFVDALKDHEAFARLIAALSMSPRGYIFPQSQAGGKTSGETSNLKSYNKVRQIAECIWSGSSNLENVAKIASVCMYRFAVKGHDVLTREVAETFLSAYSLDNITEGTREIFDAIDDIRAKHMSTGAQTQTGQMVRTLVALKSAEDVRDGRNKNVRILANAPVMVALMTRFGQIDTDA